MRDCVPVKLYLQKEAPQATIRHPVLAPGGCQTPPGKEVRAEPGHRKECTDGAFRAGHGGALLSVPWRCAGRSGQACARREKDVGAGRGSQVGATGKGTSLDGGLERLEVVAAFRERTAGEKGRACAGCVKFQNLLLAGGAWAPLPCGVAPRGWREAALLPRNEAPGSPAGPAGEHRAHGLGERVAGL